MNLRLRKLIGWGVGTAFVMSGKRCRQLSGYDEPGTVLSMFGHNPRPKVLDDLLDWLVRRGFHFISTDDLFSIRDGSAEWSPKTAWLTFDDGWAGFEKGLLPILEKHDVPATIFVAPNETERGKIWTNSVMGIVPGWQAWYGKPASERYALVDAALSSAMPSPRQLATKDELCRLAHHPLVTLENHTYTHLSCSHRPVGEVIDEVARSQGILEKWTGRVPRLVCYPFGHCTKETDAEIKQMGLVPVSSYPGKMTMKTIGTCRNMFHDVMGLRENAGRVLQAWLTVKVGN